MNALQVIHTSAQLDDSLIVRRIIAGERELFEILLRRYNQKLFRVIRTYIRDFDEVQDVMQDTYLKAFDKIQQFRGDASFSTWLIRIGINEALLRLKSKGRAKEIFLDNAPADRKMEIIDNGLNAENQMIRREMNQLLERAIDDLPEKYRIVYMLKDVEGLSNEEVCEALKVSETNLRVRLHRARKILKDNLYSLSVPAGIFEFGNAHCDAMVKRVMGRIVGGR